MYTGREKGYRVQAVPLQPAYFKDFVRRLSPEAVAWRSLSFTASRSVSLADTAYKSGKGWKQLRAIGRSIAELKHIDLSSAGPALKDLSLKQLSKALTGKPAERSQALLYAVQEGADKSQKKSAASRMEDWCTWARNSVEKGASAAQAYSKGPRLPTSDATTKSEGEGQMPVQGQQAVKLLLEAWLPRWSEGRRLQQDPLKWDTKGESLPPLTIEMLDRTLASYRDALGLGADKLHPRAILELPEDSRLRKLDLLHAWEADLLALKQFLTMVVFLDKPEGGFRPICLICCLLRVWSKMRQPIAKRWEADHAAEFFWGSATRSCERAGWVHNAFVAFSKHAGLEAITCFADLEKFYEHVAHQDLYDEAVATRFNLVLLRALCVLYSGYRAIAYQGAASDSFRVGGTIMAGCSCALALAKLLLFRSLRKVSMNNPIVHVRNVVDDVTVQACGPLRLVARQGGRAVSQLMQEFKKKRLPVSLKKTVFLASSEAVKRKISKYWTLDSAARRRHTRNLGTDATDGKRRRVATQAGRRQQALTRARRFLRLRAAGAQVQWAQRAGPTTSALWGPTVSGLPPTQLHQLRVSSTRAHGRLPKGANVGLRLRCFQGGAGRDPAILHAGQTGRAWALAVWEGFPHVALLERCLRGSASKLHGQTNPWRLASDPIDAYVLLIARLGWQIETPRYIVDDLGCKFDMLRLAPGSVEQLFRAGASRWSDRDSLTKSDLTGQWCAPVFWEALKPWLHRTRPQWSSHHQACLRALVSNTHWTQLRLWRHGLATVNKCCLCRAGEGTLWHRMYECPAWARLRSEHTTARLRRRAAVAAGAGLAVGECFARGLFPDPSPLFNEQLAQQSDEVHWVNRPASGYLTGVIFSDGSARFPQYAALRRAGWSLVQVDRFGKLVAAAFGPVPYKAAPVQQARDGEDYALHMASFLLLPPFEIYVDCAATVRCLQSPAEYSTGVSNDRAHLWAPFWANFTAEDFKAHKTKAHATAADVERGASTHWERTANAHADALAKKGAACHAVDKDALWLLLGLTEIVSGAVAWAGRLGIHMQEGQWRDAEELPNKIAEAQADAAAETEEPANGRIAVADATAESPDSAPTSAVCSALAPLRVNRHSLLMSPVEPCGNGYAIHCTSCGAYAWKRYKSLRVQCRNGADKHLLAQRGRIRTGLFPDASRADLRLGQATALTPEVAQAVLSKLGCEAKGRPKAESITVSTATPANQSMSSLKLLACFGVQEAEVPDIIAKVRADHVQRCRARSEDCSEQLLSEDDRSGEEYVSG